MWAYRTTTLTPTGHTPFTLTFGIEAIAPSKLVWPTAHVIGYQEDENEKMLLNNEEVQEELREEAQKKEFKYKRAMA